MHGLIALCVSAIAGAVAYMAAKLGWGVLGFNVYPLLFGAVAMMGMSWFYNDRMGGDRGNWPMEISPFALWPLAMALVFSAAHTALEIWAQQGFVGYFYEPAWWAAGWVKIVGSIGIIAGGYLVNHMCRRSHW